MALCRNAEDGVGEGMSETEVRKVLEKIPCLIHGKETKQLIINYNHKTGNWKIKCEKCAEQGISNILTGTSKKKKGFING